MNAIVHRTPGLIDIRAFTTMGMSAKLGNNPIGMFGTGLKYAIAVLVRMGARPVVWIGLDRYEFYCEPTKFRDKEFQLVRMKRQRWSPVGDFLSPNKRLIDLPFTTEYGRNWNMWMAFRELEANTRDEAGETYHDTAPVERIAPRAGETTIVIDHEGYTNAWERRDEVFLPGGLKDRVASEGLQVLQGSSTCVYYRGLRAMDLPKATLYTYNILSGLDLTEDRTFKYEFQVREQIARHLLTCDDPALIEQIMTCDEEYWEHGLDFPTWQKPSEAFRTVVEARPRGLWPSATSYYHRHDRRPVVATENVLDKHPQPWKLSDSQDTVEDADGADVFAAPYGYEGRWGPVGEKLIALLGFARKEEQDDDISV